MKLEGNQRLTGKRLHFGKARVIVCLLAGFAYTGVLARAQCSAPANQIVAENCLTGNAPAEWDVNGAGDTTIQGYATDISVNVGQSITFKVSTNSTNYRLDIYRLGYYAGLGARKVATVNPSVSLPQSQPACLTDVATNLIDCGNWAASAFWQVPANAVSGVYVAVLKRADTGGASHILFIVRNDISTSALLFQTSDTTWEAYNNYGGFNLYAPQAQKVSYNRPNVVRGNATVTSFFDAEYPMVRWLEANGYDVSYFTGVDANRSGQLITRHKIYMSVGHDEYWSGTQRTNVELARTAGVHLAFFSANEIFWKTRWENSIDGTNTPNRTLVCYKETTANAKTDPTSVWTGTWRDPRFSPPADGGRPENALSGTIFQVNGLDQRSIQVPAADGKMRIWRNTAIASSKPGDVAVFPVGTLGFEWDIDADNGFRPGGLIHLSTATYTVTGLYLLNYGNIFGNGTATHNMTMYRSSGGGLVFAAGTVRWSWGLDSQHDNLATVTDVRMQQATMNLLADMGGQPGSIQPGLLPAFASTDTVPPTSTIASPVAFSNATVGTPLTISGTATDFGGGVIGGVEVSVDGGLTWHPAAGRESWTYLWSPATAGAISVQVRATDDSLNTQSPVSSVTVNVLGSGSSIWSSVTPPDSGDPSAVEVGVKFRSDTAGFVNGIRFYKVPFNTGTHIGNLWSSTGTLLGSVVFSGETLSGWQQANFATPVPIAANTTYIASYFTPTGHYANNTNYFNAGGTDSPPLHALANGVDGPNGVFKYGTVSGFPDVAGSSENYWVDVAFSNNSALQISALAATPAATTAIITWTTNTASSSRVDYGLSPTALTLSSSSAVLATAHSISLTGLNAGTAYFFRVTSVDSAGNSTTSPIASGSPATFTTNSVAPVITAVIATPTSTTATVTWTTNTGSTSRVDYGVSATALTLNASSPTLVTAHSILLTGLTPGTAYFYRVSAVDSAGNSSTSPVAANPPLTFTAAAVSAPVITGVTAIPGLNSAAISWTTDTSSTSRVDYGTAPASLTLNISSATLVTNHTISLSGLTAATTYYYRVTSVDASGNSSTSPVLTSPPASFATAPSVPLSISAVNAVSGGGGSATVTWTTNSPASSRIDFGTSPTSLTLNLSDPAMLTSHTVNLSGLVLGTTYFYRVTSVDAANDTVSSPVPPATASFVENNLSVWDPSAIPAALDGGDPNSLEVGMKFRSDVPGVVTGVRFYKAAANTGVHTGHLWTSTGTLLATVTFTNETATGWQQANFASPVPISAATTYIVSYFDPGGHYSYNAGYFKGAGVDSPPLHALANGVDGFNDVYVYSAVSGFPNITGNSANYWVDLTFAGSAPPVISAVAATPAATTAAVTWTTDTNSTSRVDYGTSATTLTLNVSNASLSTAHAVSLTGLTPGTAYFYRVTSVDASGNSTTSPVTSAPPATFTTTSTTPPVITLVTATPGTTTSAITWTTDSASSSRVDYGTSATSLTSNVSSVALSTAHSISLTGLTAGTAYFYRVTSVDSAGNTATSPIATAPAATFTTTASPPVITLVTATPGTTTAAISWTTDSASTSRVDYGTSATALTLNVSTAVLSTAHSISLTGLTNGTAYFYRVTSVDSAGNTATSPIATAPPATFTTTTSPPVITLVTATPGTTTAAITWTTDSASSSRVDYGTSATALTLNVSSVALSTAHSISLAGLTAGTAYFYRVTSVDSAGNSATSPVITAPAATFTTSTLPPVITLVTATPGTTTATITWTTDKASTSRVDYGTSATALTLTVSSVALSTAHSISLTGLTSGTAYFYRVTSVDSAGNSATSPATTAPAATFTTTTPPPVITLVKATPGMATATITWTTDKTSTSRVDYGTSATALTLNASSASLVTAHSISLADLTAGTAYFYRVTSVDSAGNSATSPVTSLSPLTFTTTTQPLVITAVSVTPGSTAATITWTTDKTSNSRVDYGTSASALTLNSSRTALVTSHSVSLSGLTSGTVYFYRVTSVDAAGDSTTSPIVTAPPGSFTTIDTVPPVITSVTAVPARTTITITWTTNEAATSKVDYGTSQNLLSLNVSSGTLVTSHSLTLVGLTPNTVYFYRVTSVDASGNSASSPATARSPDKITTLP